MHWWFRFSPATSHASLNVFVILDSKRAPYTKTIHDDSAACNSVPRFFLWDNHQWPNWSLQYFSGASPQLCVRRPIAVSQPNLPENTKSATKTEDKNPLKHVVKDTMHWFGRLQSSWPACSIPTTTDQTQTLYALEKHDADMLLSKTACFTDTIIDVAQKSESTADGVGVDFKPCSRY